MKFNRFNICRTPTIFERLVAAFCHDTRTFDNQVFFSLLPLVFDQPTFFREHFGQSPDCVNQYLWVKGSSSDNKHYARGKLKYNACYLSNAPRTKENK